MLRLIIGLQSFNQPRGALLLLASILAMHGRTATLMKCARKFREIGKSASIIFGIFAGCKQYHEIGLEFWPFSPRNARDKPEYHLVEEVVVVVAHVKSVLSCKGFLGRDFGLLACLSKSTVDFSHTSCIPHVNPACY